MADCTAEQAQRPVVVELLEQGEGERPSRRHLLLVPAAIGLALIVTLTLTFVSAPRMPLLPFNEVVMTPYGPAMRVAPRQVEWTLRTDGHLEPLEEANITIETWGVITWLCADGKLVEEGETVVELDREDIDRSIANQEGELAIREAMLIQTRQNAARAIKSAETAAKRAELDLALEKQNREAVLSGSSEAAVARAVKDRDVRHLVAQNRTEELTILEDLLAQGYATSAEADSKRLQLIEATLEAERASAHLEKVTAGPTDIEARQADLRVKIAEFALDSAERRVSSVEATSRGDVVMAEQRISSVMHELRRQRNRLVHYSVKAPKTGHVLHIPDRWGIPWVPGRPVGRGNRVMSIPVAGKLKVATKVGQEAIDLVSVGMSCRVTVMADPDRPFHGSVMSISSQGRDEYEDLDPNTSAKVGKAGRDTFDVEVEILAVEPRLLPGFRAAIEFLVEPESEGIVVPWGAVFQEADAAYVTVLERGQRTRRLVELGNSDLVSTSVTQGLEEGDIVLLAVSGGRQ